MQIPVVSSVAAAVLATNITNIADLNQLANSTFLVHALNITNVSQLLSSIGITNE
jgi:hypothetical protein